MELSDSVNGSWGYKAQASRGGWLGLIVTLRGVFFHFHTPPPLLSVYFFSVSSLLCLSGQLGLFAKQTPTSLPVLMAK